MKTAIIGNGIEVSFPDDFTKADIDALVKKISAPEEEEQEDGDDAAAIEAVKSISADLRVLKDEVASLRQQISDSSVILNKSIETSTSALLFSMTNNTKTLSESAKLLYVALTKRKVLETDTEGNPVAIKVE